MPLPRRSLPVLLSLPVLGAALSYTLGVQKVRRQAVAHRTFWGTPTDEPRTDAFRLVVLGDSTAQGVGVTDPALGYVGHVESRLSALLDRPVATTNLSVSGATTTDLIADQLPALRELGFEPDLVVCVIGSNDIIKRGYEPAGFGERIGSIAAALPAGSVLGEIPCFGSAPWESRVLRLNPLLHEAAERHGHVVAHLHRASRGLWPLRIVQHVAQDLFHPNARGYAVWAEALWEAVVAAQLRSSTPRA